MYTEENWPLKEYENAKWRGHIRNFLVVPVVGTLSKLFMKYCTKLEAHNKDVFVNLVKKRDGVPLITASNHHSCADEVAICSLLNWRQIISPRSMRWSLSAHDVCYKKRIHSWFFSSGKCVPVIRGAGIYQKAMDFCIERLNYGEWVNLYPEGKINPTHERLRLKWGIGRLIYESMTTPVVLPMYHVGMDDVLPNSPPYIPRVGKLATIVVGEPIYFEEQVQKMKSLGHDAEEARKKITHRVQVELGKLRDITEELHAKRLKNFSDIANE